MPGPSVGSFEPVRSGLGPIRCGVWSGRRGSPARMTVGVQSPLLQKGAAIGHGESFAKDDRGTEPPPTEGRGGRARGVVRERRSGDGAPSYRRARRSGAGSRSRKAIGGRSPLLQKGAAIGRGESFAKGDRGTEPPPTEGRGDRRGESFAKDDRGTEPPPTEGRGDRRGESFAKDDRGTEPPPTGREQETGLTWR